MMYVKPKKYMENGYKILWTDHALEELEETYDYLISNFTTKELKKLSLELETVLRLISTNPELFPLSETKSVRRVVIKTFNTMHYRKIGDIIEILSFFNNRKHLDKRKL